MEILCGDDVLNVESDVNLIYDDISDTVVLSGGETVETFNKMVADEINRTGSAYVDGKTYEDGDILSDNEKICLIQNQIKTYPITEYSREDAFIKGKVSVDAQDGHILTNGGEDDSLYTVSINGSYISISPSYTYTDIRVNYRYKKTSNNYEGYGRTDYTRWADIKISNIAPSVDIELKGNKDNIIIDIEFMEV